MSRRNECPAWKSLLFLLGLLFTSLRPVHGAGRPGGEPAADAPSCCVDAEGCCPEDERDEPGQSYVPLCCGVDAPASAPGNAEIVSARTVADPTESVLRNLARGARTLDLQAGWIQRASGTWREEAAHAPPAGAGDAVPIGCHWLTERELRLALALLSVARI